MALLEASDLIKRYGGRRVVDGVSYTVDGGQIVGLLGRNGAGKTTSFRMTVGMVRPETGRVRFDGRDVTRSPMYARAQRGMGYLAQEPSVFRRLTVEQNLQVILETRRLSRRERKQRAEQLMSQFGLLDLRKQPARTLSGGERRKLEIARSLITEPALILLDEPFSGVDPVAVDQLQAEIQRLREERGIAMLITDHNVERTLEIVDRAYVMLDGRVFANGAPGEIVRDEQVRKHYLGSTFRGDEFG